VRRAALRIALASLACVSLTARCGGSERTGAATPGKSRLQTARKEVQVEKEKQAPPASGTARDVSFPAIARSSLKSGLEINTVELHTLPVVYIELVIRSGSASDPEAMPGLARLTASMLKEGTARRSSAELAEAIDFLGARFHVGSGQETVTIRMQALGEHLEQALSIVAEVATRPAFDRKELGKLKKRELARLAMSLQDPGYLASREFFARLYGQHPYARIDTTPQVIKKVNGNHLRNWHRAHFVPNNAFLVVAGDVTAAAVERVVDRSFKNWKPRKVERKQYPRPPEREKRSVLLVDRPESVQSVVFLGDLALPRNHADYVPFLLANEVLGGSAASRLFMDLRERRGLTYGAYSTIYEKVDVAPFRVYVAVRNEATEEALGALLEHLERISGQAAPKTELSHAKRYLVDSFPLRIDTPAKIADLLSDLRIFGLADDYWDTYRSRISEVSAREALAAASMYIRPDRALIVVVGKAAEIARALGKYGPVTVVDTEGRFILRPGGQEAAAGDGGNPPAAAKPARDTKSKKKSHGTGE
jgi:zinc protease